METGTKLVDIYPGFSDDTTHCVIEKALFFPSSTSPGNLFSEYFETSIQSLPLCKKEIKTKVMNTLSYILYLLITYIITVHVGLIFYRNGKLFILNLLHGDERLTNFINRVLLVGYYLLNLGYVAISLNGWTPVHNLTEVITTVLTKTGSIMCILALIHYFNMAAILFLSRKHHTANN
jgi:hypothetical protein